MKHKAYRHTRYSLVALKDNVTGEMFEIDCPLTMNAPIKFYKPRFKDSSKDVKIAWMNLRREDML